MVNKLLNNVLDQVSERNNEYRTELRILANFIDEKSTSLVGDIVTLSNYTVDFSNTISVAKEKLVNPITRAIESYVIRDLRCVESVNEQFVEKINDKIQNASITTDEERNSFIENLNVLLNEKYLEIVKIKRVSFLNENGSNEEIERIIEDFVSYFKADNSYDEGKLLSLFVVLKSEIYSEINKTLSKISNLYLANFVEEISMTLNGTDDNIENTFSFENNDSEFKPFVPDMQPVYNYDVPMQDANQTEAFDSMSFLTDIPNVPDMKVMPDVFEMPQIPEVPEIPSIPEIPEVPIMASANVYDEVKPMSVEPIAPIEITESKPEEKEIVKRPYDVEEILKIAKSPVVTMPVSEPVISDSSYVNVAPMSKEDNMFGLEDDFNEREIVEEMIKRLTKRLEAIDERQAKYEEERKQLESDEVFVNDLIKNSNDKKEELDSFEANLDEKEKELDIKKMELDKKIKNILPFANAVLNSEEESK